MSATRVFQLVRHQDITGVSGTGVVADGALWPDGTVTIRWRGDHPSTVHWTCLADAETVHGHGGATRFVWADDAVTDELAALPPVRTGKVMLCGSDHPLSQDIGADPTPDRRRG